MSKTILLADDSLTIQKVVELTFADTDYDVVAVSGGDELLAKIPECDPDLVICDVIMPGTDGYDVCQQIKSDPNSLHIPVILLTGTFEPFDRDRALAVGCSDIITKPFEARKLVETVERLVEGGEAEVATPAAAEPSAVTPPPDLQPRTAVAAPAAGVEDDYGTRLSGGTPGETGETPEETAMPDAAADEEAAVPEPGEPLPAPAGDGLDFTTTGFAEMEAAGEAQQGFVPPPPAEGLEFGEEEPEETAPTPGTDEPLGPPADFEFEPDGLGGADEDEEPREPEEPAVATFAEPFEPPPIPEQDDGESAATDPTMTVPLSAYQEAFGGDDTGEEAEQGEDETAAEVALPDVDAPEPEPEAFEAPAPALEGVGGELPPAAAEEPETETAEVETGDEAPALADTTPLGGPAEEPAAADQSFPATLSDEDVDRIASRVLELAADRLERIAWEVIPDMAEIVVRERIRELEAEVERAAGEADGG